MSPPTATANPATGGTTNTEAKRQTEALIRAANLVASNCGLPVGPSKVSKLVRRFRRDVEYKGVPFFDYFANAVHLDAQQRRSALANPDVARAISYADPTGESAVNNVIRQRGH